MNEVTNKQNLKIHFIIINVKSCRLSSRLSTSVFCCVIALCGLSLSVKLEFTSCRSNGSLAWIGNTFVSVPGETLATAA